MKLRHPILIRLLGFLGALIVRALVGSLRYRIALRDGIRHPTDPRRQRYLYAFWHESILAPVGFRRPVHALISQHADGELIAQVCRHLGIGVVRGSSTRGGTQALLELIERARRTHLFVTPDGPRGPRRRVQLGTVYLASRTGLPVVAVGLGFSRAWRARSWDRFAVPWPWSTVYCVASPAINVPPGLDRGGLEHYRQLIEEEFLTATAAAEAWAECRSEPRADEKRLAA